MGERLKFYLSLGLFSSFAVDSGTRLLLKTLAKQDAIPENGSVLDSGCGTGIIALCLKKRFPALGVTASDRNALALRFTEMNADLNKISRKGFRTASGLLPGRMKNPVAGAPGKYNLIVSNIPAKAGGPVIEDFLKNCGTHLEPGGIAAVVIVATLSGFAEECLNDCGAEIVYSEAGKQYSVFHFVPPEPDPCGTFADIYERTGNRISGFWGLPEFDSVSYGTKVTLETLKGFACSGRTLLWNPGLGHVPAACPGADEIILAGSDLLQLKASEFNTAAGSAYHHLPLFRNLEGTVGGELDQIIASPDFISGAGVEHEVTETSLLLLKPGGRLLVSGKSSDIAKIEKADRGFIKKNSIKYRGFRALLLEKQK